MSIIDLQDYRVCLTYNYFCGRIFQNLIDILYIGLNISFSILLLLHYDGGDSYIWLVLLKSNSSAVVIIFAEWFKLFLSPFTPFG